MTDVALGIDAARRHDLASTLIEALKEATFEVFNEVADSMVYLAKVLVKKDTRTLETSIRKLTRGDVIKVVCGGSLTNPKTGKPVSTYALIIEMKFPFMKPAWIMVSAGMDDRIKQRAISKVYERFS